MAAKLSLPRLYAIADAGLLAARGVALEDFVQGLCAAGVDLIQYRDKSGSPREILDAAARIRKATAGTSCRLILNDRADLAVLADFDGVHVGHRDLAPEDARRVVGPGRIVGVSTHNDEQVRAADSTSADYIAIGPAFATGTKLDTEPIVGLEGIRRARALTAKPLVAIGGITLANARSVLDAGADSVAIISALLAPGANVQANARELLAVLG